MLGWFARGKSSYCYHPCKMLHSNKHGDFDKTWLKEQSSQQERSRCAYPASCHKCFYLGARKKRGYQELPGRQALKIVTRKRSTLVDGLISLCVGACGATSCRRPTCCEASMQSLQKCWSGRSGLIRAAWTRVQWEIQPFRIFQAIQRRHHCHTANGTIFMQTKGISFLRNWIITAGGFANNVSHFLLAQKKFISANFACGGSFFSPAAMQADNKRHTVMLGLIKPKPPHAFQRKKQWPHVLETLIPHCSRFSLARHFYNFCLHQSHMFASFAGSLGRKKQRFLELPGQECSGKFSHLEHFRPFKEGIIAKQQTARSSCRWMGSPFCAIEL